jgi:hypothetical protein
MPLVKDVQETAKHVDSFLVLVLDNKDNLFNSLSSIVNNIENLKKELPNLKNKYINHRILEFKKKYKGLRGKITFIKDSYNERKIQKEKISYEVETKFRTFDSYFEPLSSHTNSLRKTWNSFLYSLRPLFNHANNPGPVQLLIFSKYLSQDVESDLIKLKKEHDYFSEGKTIFRHGARSFDLLDEILAILNLDYEYVPFEHNTELRYVIPKSIANIKKSIIEVDQFLVKIFESFELAKENLNNIEISWETLKTSFVHELNKRLSTKLRVEYFGREITIPVKIIFNFIDLLPPVWIDHFIDKFRSRHNRRRFKQKIGNDTIEMMDSEEKLDEILQLFHTENPKIVYTKIVDTLLNALRSLFSNSEEHFAPFYSKHFKGSLTITITKLSSFLNPKESSAGRVTGKFMLGGNPRRLIYVKQPPPDLNFQLDTNYILEVSSGKISERELVSTIWHEINHILSGGLYTGDFDKIREEGYATFSEIALNPKNIYQRQIKYWFEREQKGLSLNFRIKKDREEALEDKYKLGLMMWLEIFMYFTNRNSKIRSYDDIINYLVTDEGKKNLAKYLRIFRQFKTKNFLNFYYKAATHFRRKSLFSKKAISKV